MEDSLQTFLQLIKSDNLCCCQIMHSPLEWRHFEQVSNFSFIWPANMSFVGAVFHPNEIYHAYDLNFSKLLPTFCPISSL